MQKTRRAFGGLSPQLRPEVDSDEGQTVTEYGIVLGVLMLLLAATALLLEPGVQSVVTTAGNKVSGILP